MSREDVQVSGKEESVLPSPESREGGCRGVPGTNRGSRRARELVSPPRQARAVLRRRAGLDGGRCTGGLCCSCCLWRAALSNQGPSEDLTVKSWNSSSTWKNCLVICQQTRGHAVPADLFVVLYTSLHNSDGLREDTLF